MRDRAIMKRCSLGPRPFGLSARLRRDLGVVVMCGCLVVASGCALTSKGAPLSIRWFSPETATTHVTSAQSIAAPARAPFVLELGRVTSGANLRERIAYRDSAFEVGFYDDKRWTERPEVFVRRVLARTLFEEHGFGRALAGQAPVLDVEVVAFEEVRQPARAARVQLRIVLHDDRETLLEKTVTVERSAPSAAFSEFVQSMAQALDAAAAAVAHDVESAISDRARVPRPPSR